MGVTTVEDILEMVAFHLLEPVLSTALLSPLAVGTQTASVGSVAGLYAGALVLVGTVLDAEQVTVASVGAGTFVATFANAHPVGDPVRAAPFPSGQPSMPLWTQAEILGYVSDAQNELLLDARPTYNYATQPCLIGVRYYPLPADCIRAERIAVQGAGGRELYETSQAELDLYQARWEQQTKRLPTHRFVDDLDILQFGVYPLSQMNFTAEIWYSQSGPANLTLPSSLLVPEILVPYLKWGVVNRALAKDGEARDPERAAYARKRFEFGVALASRLMDLVGIPDSKPGRRRGYSPMAVE